MKVTCVNVNYFTQGKYVEGASPDVKQVPGATVTFASADAATTDNLVESFTLTYTNLQGALDFFPGGEYDLTFKAATK